MKEKFEQLVENTSREDTIKILEYANKMICDLKNDEKHVDAVKYLESIIKDMKKSSQV